MQDQYCTGCLQHRSEKHFTIWLNDKTKSRRCDDCSNSDTIKKRVQAHEKERRSKKKAVPQILQKLADTIGSERKRVVSDRLYKIAEQKRIDDEIGI